MTNKKFRTLLLICLLVPAIPPGILIWHSGVVGFVIAFAAASFYTKIPALALAGASEEQVKVAPTLILFIRKAHIGYFMLMVAVWFIGLGFWNWTWRSLVTATVAFMLIQWAMPSDSKPKPSSN